MTDTANMELIARIKALSQPLTPQPTGAEPVLGALPGIRALLFDIYGTLMISASGDIGLGGERDEQRAFRAALAAVGLEPSPAFGDLDGSQRLKRSIEDFHAERRASGVAYPEVDIVRIWQQTLARIPGLSAQDLGEPLLRRLALDYECRVNPVWPMPGLGELLAALQGRGLALGVVSNAQFYTPLMFQAFLGSSLESLGFQPRYCAWSYRLREAKPSTRLNREALAALEREAGIQPQEVLYLGNDMLKDIWPASRVGCRTVLFAGDARSLRLREGDERCAGVQPDRVITELDQITACLTKVDGDDHRDPRKQDA